MKHIIAHLLGLNTGLVVCEYDSKGNMWVGFKCSGCGKVSGAHIAHEN